MKKRKWPFLSLLLIAPFLLGNAPAPYPHPTNYSDYTNTPFVEKALEENKFSYTTSVTNTGYHYISCDSIVLLGSNSGTIQNYDYNYDIILPGATYEIVFVTNRPYVVSDFSLAVQAFSPLGETYRVGNISNLTREHREETNQYLYRYDVEIDVDTPNFYGIITEYKYGGETFASHNGHNLDDGLFWSETLMEVEDIEIVNVYLTKGRSRNNGYGGMMIALVLLAIFIFITALALIIGVPLVLTLLLIKLRQKKQGI